MSPSDPSITCLTDVRVAPQISPRCDTLVCARVPKDDLALRYVITASITFQALLLDGFIPRGGLGWAWCTPGLSR